MLSDNHKISAIYAALHAQAFEAGKDFDGTRAREFMKSNLVDLDVAQDQTVLWKGMPLAKSREPWHAYIPVSRVEMTEAEFRARCLSNDPLEVPYASIVIKEPAPPPIPTDCIPLQFFN